VAKALCVFRDFGTFGGIEVVDHMAIEGGKTGRGTDFSTHVTDGSHAGAREGFDTGSVVFDDGACTSFDGEDGCHFENDVYTRNDQPNILFLRERLTHPLESHPLINQSNEYQWL
jgi:hypothetical protein